MARSWFARMMFAKFRNGEGKFEIFEKRTFLFFCKVFTFSPILTSMKIKLIRINKLFETLSKRWKTLDKIRSFYILVSIFAGEQDAFSVDRNSSVYILQLSIQELFRVSFMTTFIWMLFFMKDFIDTENIF